MKKLMKSLMLFAAAAMALTSCENEAMNEGIEDNGTVTMTFTAGAPESKTAINTIDAKNGVVSFKWNDGDVIAFIQEADKTTKSKSKTTSIAEDGAATFTVDLEAFSNSCNVGAYYPDSNPPQDKTFDNIEVSLSGVQTLTSGSFDPKADLLMSQPVVVNSKNKDNFGGNLKFTRLAAIGHMNLKGVATGETLQQVKLTFADAEALNGTVALDFATIAATYGTDGTNTISLNGELTANENGTYDVYFTCFPRSITGAYTIEVTTDKATYSKEGNLPKALSFTAGNVLSFNASVNKVQKADKVDVLNRAFTNVSGTSYADWSGKTGTSGAVYAGNSAGSNDAIQLRSNNNNSGIVTTTSGGVVKKVVVTWHSGTADDRTLNIYGKNTAYSAATDLYDTNQGTLLGTIVKGTSTELVIDGEYEYIGLRSKSGAMYLSQIEITWATGAGAGGETPEPEPEPDPEPDPETPSGEEVTATITFDNITKRTEFTTSVQVWQENGITVTNNKSASTTDIGNYSNPVRFYKSSEVIIAAPSTITKLVIESPADGSQNNQKYLTFLQNSLNGTVSVVGTTVTVVPDTVSNTYTFSATEGQIRFYSVAVTYISSGSETPEPDEPETPAEPTKLDTPTNLQVEIDELKVSLQWTGSANATSYYVTCGDESTTVTATEALFTMDAAGTYDIKVVAKAEGYTDSDALTGTANVTESTGGGDVETIVTANFAPRQVTATNKTLSDDQGNSWVFTSDAAGFTSSQKYVHAGSNSKTVSHLTFTSNIENVKSVTVNAAAKANTSASIKVYIGNTLIGTSSVLGATQDSGGTAFTVENTNNISGALKIVVSRPSSAKGALYFNSANVTYAE